MKLDGWSSVQDDHVLVCLAGDLDMAVRDELAVALVDAVDQGFPVVVVDLSRVTLLAAAAVHALEHAAELLSRRRGVLHLVCPAANPGVLRVLRILDLDRLWPVHPDITTAVQRLHSAVKRP